MEIWEINAPAKGLRWLFPTKTECAKAGALQDSVGFAERDSSTDASPDAVALATVHARQDQVLIYAMAVAQHRQMVNISRGVWVLVFLGLIIAGALSK